MTLEQILDCSATDLEKLTEADLSEHFKQYLCVTRPELVARPKERKEFDPIARERQLKIAQLAALGIDVSMAVKGRKK